MVATSLNASCNSSSENSSANRDKASEDGGGEFLVGRVGGLLSDEVAGFCCGGLDVMMVSFFC